MLYLATPSTPEVRDAMRAGLLGCITTPRQGNRIPDGTLWAADNGRFGDGWRGYDDWWSWLQRRVAEYGPDRCLFAVAPDRPFDAAGTLEDSLPWLPRIRALGIPAGFAAQNGSEDGEGLIPWDELGPDGVVFLAGDDEWKLGDGAAKVADEARHRGLWVHMGRVNTRRRLRIAEVRGCSSVDGTTFAQFPDASVRTVLPWLADMRDRPSLFAALADGTEPTTCRRTL